MMALASCQLQGSCSTFPSVPSSWSRGSKLKHVIPTLHAVGRKDRFHSLRWRSSSSVGAPLVGGPNSKLFKISAFKGGGQHDDSDGRSNGSKSLKNPIKVNGVPAPYTQADEATTRSVAIQNLFKNWLMLLRAPSQTQPVEEVNETPEMPSAVQKQERGEVLKAMWYYFMGFDATIKIPLLIFAPLYLGFNLVYGSEVSKELIPLWIMGPLLVALYVKMFRAICGLYVFSFKQTVKVIKNVPAYYFVVHNLIAHGQLKESMEKHIWKPLADMKNMDYKEVSWRKIKDLQGWLLERYLDFIELIWPYYCRTIRFLKRTNLI